MLKRLEARNMQVVFTHPFFKLIRVCEPGKEQLKPLVLINEPEEIHLQRLENKLDIYPACGHYSNHFEYDDNIHTPYIFCYDYKIYGINRDYITNEAFASGLCAALQALELDNVDIMGLGHGGMIGIMASKDPRVDKVMAMHSPIYGMPISKLDSDNLKKLKCHEKLLILGLKMLYDRSFAFIKEDIEGFKQIEQVGDLSKIFFTTCNIVELESGNEMLNRLANMNQKYLDLGSDGLIIFDEERMLRDGLNFEIEYGLAHSDINNLKYTTNYYEKLVRHL